MNKKFVLGLGLCLVLFNGVESLAAQIDPALVPFAQGRTEQRAARVVLTLTTRTEGMPVPQRYNHQQVIAYLKAISGHAQNTLRQYLGTQPQAPQHVRLLNAWWINSSLTAEVTPLGLRILAQAPSVGKIYANHAVKRVPVRRGARVPRPDAAMPYPYSDLGIDRLIKSDPRVDGSGVLIGHIDTGVDGTHPALQGKIFKYWDSESRSYARPVDSDSHGTHTAGTIVGGDRRSIQIGVAPGAKLIASGPLDDFDGMLASMQIMLDPDGNAGTKDLPRAVSCSWHAPGAPDMELFYSAVGAWEAAGILPVFAAGNSGPAPRTIAHPQSHPIAFVIGATRADGKVTDFSSRGPATYHGQTVQKPDITAPGDNVRSSVPGGGYEEMSGTSMATPHAAGTTALLFQVDPAFTPDQVRKILIASARPVNPDGSPANHRGVWNANYGLGKMDAFAAVQLAKTTHHARFLKDVALPFLLSPEDVTVQDILSESAVGVDEVIQSPEWVDPAAGWAPAGQVFAQ